MNIAKVFVKKMWGAIVVCCFLSSLGGISFSHLDWSLNTKVANNEIYISTSCKNQITLEEMMKYTTALEKRIKSIKGIDYFESATTDHDLYIGMILKKNTSAADFMVDLKETLITVKRNDSIKFPSIHKTGKKNPPIMTVEAYSKTENLRTLTDYAKGILTGIIERIPGVAYVEVNGMSKPEIKIEIDPAKLALYNIQRKDIERSFDTYNSELGMMKRNQAIEHFGVFSPSNIKTISDIENTIIIPSRQIRIADIAKVYFADKDLRSENWVNGTTLSLNLRIYKTTDGNPLIISKHVKKAIDDWKKKHNLVCHIEDHSKEIELFFNKTKQTFIESIIIVILITFLFLGSLKACITPILAIPISIISTFFVMHITGCSINTSTLMAFLLSIGLVVDDAIVVVENIIKYYKKSRNWETAAIEGTGEIQTAIIVMTLTLSFVFFPAIIAEGAFGSTLKEFAITLSTCTMFSGIVALVLTPMVSARTLEYNHFSEKFILIIETFYERALKRTFRFRYIFAIFFVGAILSTVFVARKIPRETFPFIEKKSFKISTITIRNKNMAFLKEKANILVNILEKKDYINNFSIKIENGLYANIDIKPACKISNKVLQKEILKDLSMKIKDLNFLAQSKQQDANFGIYLYGNSNRDEINENGERFARILRDNCPGIKSAITWNVKKEAWNVNIDYATASFLNVDINQLKEIINTTNSRIKVSVFNPGSGKKYNVVLCTPNNSSIKDNINYVWVAPKDLNQQSISPSLFTEYHLSQKEETFMNCNGVPGFDISISTDPSYKMSEIIDNIIQYHKKYVGNKADLFFTGEAKQFLEEKDEMTKMFVLSILFIFMILLAQFESLLSVLVVMTTIPLALIGVILVLRIKGTINIYSIIGIITLIGLIAKHGILFVNTANKYLEDGLSIEDASQNAAVFRLRAVLMTTLAMAFGVLPLLFEKSDDMIRLVEMARVLFPGLCFGTLMTLFITPNIYLILMKNQKPRISS